jgi:CheY-like chemotaxis protein
LPLIGFASLLASLVEGPYLGPRGPHLPWGDGRWGALLLVNCPKCQEVSCPVSGVAESRSFEHVCPSCHHVFHINPTDDDSPNKILVVDDSATIRNIAGEILTSAGYEVLKAMDGPQALTLAHKEHPDLIVLDLVMPKMTGFDVIREMRNGSRLKATPILIITAIVPGQEVRDDLHQYGVTDFISKAHLMESLLTRVQVILSKPIHRVA